MADQYFLDSVFKLLPTPSLILLPDRPKYTVLWVNKAYLDIVQSSENELTGKGFFEDFPDNPFFQSPPPTHLLDKLVADREPNKSPVFEYYIRVPNSEAMELKYFISSNNPVFDEQNELKYIIRTLLDVTEETKKGQQEKRMHASLATSEKLLNETQRIANVGSWEAYVDIGEIMWSSVTREIHEAEASFEPTFDAVIALYKKNTNCWELIVSEVEKSMSSGRLFDLELEIWTLRDNKKWVRIRGNAVLEDGHCTRIYGTVQDITDRKVSEQKFLMSQDQYESLIQTVDGIVWESKLCNYEFTFISNQVKDILGFTSEEWMDEPYFWENHIHVEDREQALKFCAEKSKISENYDFDYRMIHANGNVIWIKDIVSVIKENGVPVLLRGVMIDITESKRMVQLERLEKDVLEFNSRRNASIQDVLSMYLRGIEAIFPKMLCSILQVKNNKLYNWSSASLPNAYLTSIEGLAIADNTGSCGTAAFFKESVIASDIESDPRWKDFKDLALAFDLRACWSMPVLNAEDEVIATFGIYYKEKKLPEKEELKTIERFAAILKIILENRLNSELLAEATFLMEQGQELAHFGNWQWDVIRDTVIWSDTLYSIYGLEKSGFKASISGYMELLHPDDKDRVVEKIQWALRNGEDVVFEERIIRPDGEIRQLKSWGRVKMDESGKPVKMIGACLDISESKKIQLELLESETKLKGLLQAMKLNNERYEFVNKATKDAIYDWDMSVDHIAWGDGYFRLFGYEAEGEKHPLDQWSNRVHPVDVETIKKSLALALNNKNQHNWRAEYQFRRSDGRYAFVQENGYIIRTASGEAVRMIGVLRDITQRKKTQLKLLRKSGLLAAIAEVNSNLLQHNNWLKAMGQSLGIIGEAVDADRVYYFEQYNDHRSGEVYYSQKLEWNSGRFMAQIDAPVLQHMRRGDILELAEQLEAGKPFFTEVYKLPPSPFKTVLITQEIASLLILPVFVKKKLYGFIGLDDCQRERKWNDDEVSFLKTISVNLAKAIESGEADKALLAAYEEKNRTLESIRDGFFAVSKNWTVTYWNREAENLTGIRREDILGNSIWETYYKTVPSRFYNQYLKAFNENIPVRFEEYFPRHDKWFEINAYPTDDGLTVYFKDITERKLGEAKLMELHEELEKNLKVLAVSNAELEQFAYVASHDLQEPLRMVTGFLSLLEKKYTEVLDEKAKLYIHFAVDGATRMRQIILDLLDFSRVGKTKERLEEVDFNEVIQEILLLYTKNIKETKAKVVYDKLPVMFTFRSPVRQVFQNLISNGLKYQPKGQSPHITITSKDSDSHWLFSVKDNGIGIDPQYFSKIFIIFQRLHNREDYSGTGMGLAITRKIVESLGGQIWVESKEGEGSTFYFSIAKQQQLAL
jgi:PAS domain S-box-containing protein